MGEITQERFDHAVGKGSDKTTGRDRARETPSERNMSELEKRARERPEHALQNLQGLRADELFEGAEPEQPHTVGDLVNRYGSALTERILSDAVGTSVKLDLYNEDGICFQWQLAGQYPAEDLLLQVDENYPLSFDENGRMMNPERWLENNVVRLLSNIKFHEDYKVQMLCGVRMASDHSKQIRKFRLLTSEQLRKSDKMAIIYRATAMRPSTSDNNHQILVGEDKDYLSWILFYQKIHTEFAKGEDYGYYGMELEKFDDDIRVVARCTLLRQLWENELKWRSLEEIFWRKWRLMRKINDADCELTRHAKIMEERIQAALHECLSSQVAHEDNVRLPSFADAPKHEGVACSLTDSEFELGSLLDQLLNLQKDFVIYSLKIEQRKSAWLKYAPRYVDLHCAVDTSIQVEVFGDHAELTLPQMNAAGTSGYTTTKHAFNNRELGEAIRLVRMIVEAESVDYEADLEKLCEASD